METCACDGGGFGIFKLLLSDGDRKLLGGLVVTFSFDEDLSSLETVDLGGGLILILLLDRSAVVAV